MLRHASHRIAILRAYAREPEAANSSLRDAPILRVVPSIAVTSGGGQHGPISGTYSRTRPRPAFLWRFLEARMACRLLIPPEESRSSHVRIAE